MENFINREENQKITIAEVEAILRNEEDPIYINEVLINHLQSDANVAIDQIPSEMLDDGLIERSELVEICTNLIKTIIDTVALYLVFVLLQLPLQLLCLH